MAYFDVFNGDADGICALVQLRNHTPADSQLITGVKRDIELLDQVQAAAGDQITVLDVSMEKNHSALVRVLDQGANVLYMDHHFAGDIPAHPQLKAVINEAADTCTSILMNTYLKGAYCLWAITGAFGDNLMKSAQALAKSQHLDADTVTRLENLGTYINYNGYGSDLADLHFTPTDLYRKMVAYASPLDFMTGAKEDFQKLEQGYHEDMSNAANLKPIQATSTSAVFVLPDLAWARRVSGVYSNDLANNNPDRAHAVLTEKTNGNYLVSVRAPLTNKTGAVDLCRQFPTGGGRAAAAGINDLPATMLEEFTQKLDAMYRAN